MGATVRVSFEGGSLEGHWWGGLVKEQLDASGMLYRRNRYYDAATGRFSQVDPIGLAGGLNLYGFADGDPVNFSDPFGLCPWHDVGCWEDKMWAASGGSGVAGRVLAPLASTLLEFSGATAVDEHSKQAAGGSRAGMALLALDVAASVVPGAGELEGASARLLGEAARGQGARVIAGAGHARGKAINDIARFVETYGGKASDWAKMSGRSFKSSTGKQIEVHWYENVLSGERYEFKTKLVKGWP
jgi:RHS repeat-associated protein